MNSAPANSAACDGVTLGANDPIHVNVLIGDDAWAGTTSCPKATIASAVESASAGDEVIVHEGLYHENITIDGKDDLTLRAATGEARPGWTALGASQMILTPMVSGGQRRDPGGHPPRDGWRCSSTTRNRSQHAGRTLDLMMRPCSTGPTGPRAH